MRCVFDGTLLLLIRPSGQFLRLGTLLALNLDAAGDDEGVLIGEFDGDVGLVEAGEFALEVVGVFDFFEVEAGGEKAGLVLFGIGLAAGGFAVGEFVEEGEEWGDVVVVVARDGGAPVVGGGGEAGEASERHDGSFGGGGWVC